MLHVAPIKPKSIDRYRLPDVQLTLVGRRAEDDPEGGWGVSPAGNGGFSKKRQGG